MKIKVFNNLNVQGFAVRTKNIDEMEPSKAKIGNLWDRFYREIAPHLSAESRVFGIYTNYESDHTGDFTVLAGTDVLNNTADHKLQSTKIPDGNYLVFSGAGEMPQAVINLWTEVWQYFGGSHCKHIRAYTTDFELYPSATAVDIYIAIKDEL
jgi:predicted transcriptional regulator YdeE